MPNDKVITLDNLSRFKTDLYADFILDITQAQTTEQATLGSVYNQVPNVVRVTTDSDGVQMYKLDNNYKEVNNKVYYSCLLFGALVEMSITESDGTYTLDVQRYDLTSMHN